MSKKKMSLVIGLIGAGSIMAQAPIKPAPVPTVVGKTEDVQGLVTVSDGNTISNVRSKDPIIRGTRYVTSSTGSSGWAWP